MSYRTDAQLATDNSNISTLGGSNDTKIEKVEFQTMVSNLIDSKRNAKTWERGWYDVRNHGCTSGVDCTTALQTLINTVVAAGGGSIYFPIGLWLIAGPLQDTGNANAQVYFPQVNLDSPTITINLIGETPPPHQFFTASALPSPTQYSIIKSTLTGASGLASCIGSKFSDQFSLAEQNNIQVNVFDLIFEAPPNATFTMFNGYYFQAGIYDRLLFHCGEVRGQLVVQPTNSNSYGLKLPNYNHTPGTIVGRLAFYGWYTGVKLTELAIVNNINAVACWVGIEFGFAYHGCVVNYYFNGWCKYGINVTGQSVSQIRLYDVEYSNGFAAAWQDGGYMLYDPFNAFEGKIIWDTIYSAVGRVNDFTVYGGSKAILERSGASAILRYSPTGSTDNTHPNGTICQDDTYLYYRNSSGTWKKIAWTTF